MIDTGCDLQVVVFLSLLLFWTKHHSTTETPPHNATISTTHDTPNAILHGPRYDPFRVGKGPRTRAYGAWRKKNLRGCAGFLALFSRLPGVDEPPVRDRTLPSVWTRNVWSRELGGAMGGERGGGPPDKRTDTERIRGPRENRF